MSDLGWLAPALRWYGLLILVTWGWAPLVRLLCGRLADRGALLVRPLAMMGVIYPTWLLVGIGLTSFSSFGLWITLGIGAALGWAAVIRLRLVDRGWLGALLIGEAISLAAFAGYVWLHGFTPEILYTEKPMDVAFLASSARSAVVPPVDPWFAGEPINYYYLGYLIHGGLARMSGVAATTAFNLALATTFAATATAAVGLGFDAAKFGRARGGDRLAAVVGGLTALFLVGVGNLYAAARLLSTPSETIAAHWWDSRYGIGWRASRIVCDGARVDNACRPPAVETINEFPFFSFLLGDLHPHLMALPFAVVALALSVNLLARATSTELPRPAEWIGVALTGGVVGSLYGLNSWDFPTYLLVAAFALWVGWSQLHGRRRGLALGTLIGAGVVAWLPFALRFVPPTGRPSGAPLPLLDALPVVPGLLNSIAMHSGERTSIGEYLTMFGVPYVFAVLLIVSGFLQERGGRTTSGPAPSRPAIVFALLALAASLLLPAPVFLLCGLPLAGALWLLRADPRTTPRTIALALFALGFALSLVVELLFLRDAFGTRMNTLFKVYYQVWTLFAAAAALSVVVLWREAGAATEPAAASAGGERTRRIWTRVGVAALTVVAVAAGLAYPVVASVQWAEWSTRFGGWNGLDGVAYVGEIDPAELAAIRWLQVNGRPDDVVLEAAGCSYQPNGDIPFSRIAAYTGIPTVVGWGHGHETQWRAGRPEWLAEIGQRERDVAQLFAEPRGELLDRYGVKLLYLGRYESEDWRDECGVAGAYPGVDEPDYPGTGWEPVFAEGDVRIFRRVEGAG